MSCRRLDTLHSSPKKVDNAAAAKGLRAAGQLGRERGGGRCQETTLPSFLLSPSHPLSIHTHKLVSRTVSRLSRKTHSTPFSPLRDALSRVYIHTHIYESLASKRSRAAWAAGFLLLVFYTRASGDARMNERSWSRRCCCLSHVLLYVYIHSREGKSEEVEERGKT